MLQKCPWYVWNGIIQCGKSHCYGICIVMKKPWWEIAVLINFWYQCAWSALHEGCTLLSAFWLFCYIELLYLHYVTSTKTLYLMSRVFWYSVLNCVQTFLVSLQWIVCLINMCLSTLSISSPYYSLITVM